MADTEELLDEVYAGQERITGEEIHRRAVALDLPAGFVAAIGELPEGEYLQEEAAEALDQLGVTEPEPARGVPPVELTDDDLIRELEQLHTTRHDTFRHGSDQALAHHDARTAELEAEYLTRFPEREVEPQRLRDGARSHS